MVGGLVQEQHEGPNEEGSGGQEGDRAASVQQALHRRGLPCLPPAILVRPGLSPEVKRRLYAAEGRGELGEKPEWQNGV